MEQSFALAYCVSGMTPEYVDSMEKRERTWWVDRTNKQKKAERDAAARK